VPAERVRSVAVSCEPVHVEQAWLRSLVQLTVQDFIESLKRCEGKGEGE
jgi:hypothetical protein